MTTRNQPTTEESASDQALRRQRDELPLPD